MFSSCLSTLTQHYGQVILLETCIAGWWCSLSHKPPLREKRSLQVVLPCVAPERFAARICWKAVLTWKQRTHDPACTACSAQALTFIDALGPLLDLG